MNSIPARRIFLHGARFRIRRGPTVFPPREPPRRRSILQHGRTMTTPTSDRGTTDNPLEPRTPPYPINHPRSADSYRRAIHRILSGKTFQAVQSSLEKRGLWSKHDYGVFRHWLLDKDSVMDHWEERPSDPRREVEHRSSETHSSSSFHKALNRRRREFQRCLPTTVVSTTQFPPSFFPMVQLVFRELANSCSIADGDPNVVMTAWEKIRECGAVLDEPCTAWLWNSILTCSNDVHSTMDQRKREYVREVAAYLRGLYGPKDFSEGIVARELLLQGKVSLAEEVLKECVRTTQNKDVVSETYVSVLEAYCKSNDVKAAVSLFQSLKGRRGVVLSLDMHLLLISTLAANGYWSNRNDTMSIQLLDEILFSISMKVSTLDYASAKQLYNALAVTFQSDVEQPSGSTGISSDDIPVLTHPAKHNEVVAGRVLLDTATGTCPVTNVKLKFASLDADQRSELRSGLLDLAKELYAKSPEYKSTECVDRAANELMKFSDWLRKRKRKKFTAIVDGANVGFYMRKYSNGKFSYRQIQAVVSGLEAKGERPLVILPHKYTKPGFIISDRYRQRLDRDESEILDSLKKDGKLFIVPAGCQDDLYCMIALLQDQDDSEDAARSDASTQLARYPYLVTNDRFRDHSLQLKIPFRRLYGCHAVHYKFDRFSSREGCIDVQFMAADLFVTKIQLHKCPAYKTFDELGGTWTGTVWHFPVKRFSPNERFVVRIPQLYDSG